MILPLVYTTAATFCFAVIFRLKGWATLYAAIGGGIGLYVFLVSSRWESALLFAYFLASFSAGIYAEIMARITKKSAAVFISCSIIPLVPGETVYKTMVEAIHNNLEASLSLGLQMITIAGAIAAGVALSASFIKLIPLREKGAKNIP